MSDKLFHINENGDAMPCNATKRPCPVGGGHFPTADAARAAYEDLAQQAQDLSRVEDAPLSVYSKLYQGQVTPATIAAEISTLDPDEDLTKGAGVSKWIRRNVPEAKGDFIRQVKDALASGPVVEEIPEEQQFFGSVDEALLHHRVGALARRAERMAELTTADAYFAAEEQGYFLERNPETTSLEVESAEKSSVQEAFAYGHSLRGFSTQQLFDQLGSATNQGTPHGRRNMGIRKELDDRLYGDYLQKRVSLSSDQDFRDAYDVGLFYPEGISDAADRRLARITLRQNGSALAQAEEGKDISGFSTEAMFAGDLSNASPKAKARLQNELRLRLKVDEAPSGEESPF